MFATKVLSLYFSLLDKIFGLVFGQKYKRLVKKCTKVFKYTVKVFTRDENKIENNRNDLYIRLDRLKEILAGLNNKVVSLERKVKDITYDIEMKKALPPPPPPPPVTTIPIPPPLPPTPIFTCPAPSKRSDDKLVLKAVRVLHEEELVPLEPKRSKPSSVDLIKGKESLRSTTVRRSPGGTPMSGWKVTEIDWSSSPDDMTTAALLKKALKRKFMNARPFSPPSPIEASDGDEFSF